jgi:HEAT repeat protein
MDAAQHDPDRSVRRVASRALRDLGDPASAPCLLDALTHSDDHVLRMHACRGLANAIGPDAIPPLGAALKDPNPWVRDEAALALGRIGDPSAIPLIEAARKGTRNPLLRFTYRLALKRIRENARRRA